MEEPEVESRPSLPESPPANESRKGEPLPEARGRFFFEGPEGVRPGWRMFAYLGMAFVTFFMLSMVVSVILPEARLWSQMASEALLAISVLVPGFVMAGLEDRPFGSYGLPGRQAFGKQFWAGALWGLASFSLFMLLLREVGVLTLGQVAVHGGRAWKFGAFWAVFFLLVGFFEESALRGYLQFTLGNAIGFWRAAVVLSLVFGAIHVFNPGEVWIGELGAGAIGLFFCLTLRRTGSLWFAVGMHSAWDWAESYVYSVPDSGEVAQGHLLNTSLHGSPWLTGGSVGPEGSVLVFVVVALMWVVFDRVYRPRDGATDRTGENARPPSLSS